MSKKSVLFISSTGGHLEELLQLSPMFKKYDYHIVTEKTKSNEYLANVYSGRIDFLALNFIFLVILLSYYIIVLKVYFYI